MPSGIPADRSGEIPEEGLTGKLGEGFGDLAAEVEHRLRDREEVKREKKRAQIRKGVRREYLEHKRDKVSNLRINFEAKMLGVRDAYVEAFERVGGLEGLVRWAGEGRNRGQFYKMLLGLFPKELMDQRRGGFSLVVHRHEKGEVGEGKVIEMGDAEVKGEEVG